MEGDDHVENECWKLLQSTACIFFIFFLMLVGSFPDAAGQPVVSALEMMGKARPQQPWLPARLVSPSAWWDSYS